MEQRNGVLIEASTEYDDSDFADALATLRKGVDGYGDRISANAAVLRAVDDLTISTNILAHEKVSQSVWRYDHDAEVVRGEIKRTIEREDDEETKTDEIVAAFCIAADRLNRPILADN